MFLLFHKAIIRHGNSKYFIHRILLTEKLGGGRRSQFYWYSYRYIFYSGHQTHWN
jgi:hypothetical protein